MRIGSFKILELKDIPGCDENGDGDSVYLSRLSVFSCPWFQVLLHKFNRSDDARAFHNHPWNFLTIPLRYGYYDITPGPVGGPNRRQWCGILRPRFRRAGHVHRVELPSYLCEETVYGPRDMFRTNPIVKQQWKERQSVTLVFTGPIIEKWGFITNGVWEHWQDYGKRLGCREPSIRGIFRKRVNK